MRRSANMLTGLYRSTGAAAVALSLAGVPAEAAQMLVPRIDSFGPYKLGMTLDQATAAHKGGKPAPCGEIAADRQCIVLDAAVFDEPGVIYAVLDASGGKVERIVAQLDPQLTRRRAYRCVRLAEKVFSLLAVVYGSKYKQSYDQDRKPLPAVAWDGALSGRLIFETRCRSADEGNPRISVVEHHPEGVEPPKIAEKTEPKPAAPPLPPALALPSAAEAAPGVSAPLAIEAPVIDPRPAAGLPASISLATPEAPVPARAPIGVVEEIKLDTSGAAARDGAMAALTRELAQAKGKAEKPAPPTPVPAATPAAAPSVDNAVAARLAPLAQQGRPGDADELPEPPDLVAPEPFMVPEEEELFRQRREQPRHAGAVPPPQRSAAAAAPFALLSVTPPASPQPQPQPVPQPRPANEAQYAPAALARTAAAIPLDAAPPTPGLGLRSLTPVLTGGWRHRAPIPPARPWRERADAAGPGAS